MPPWSIDFLVSEPPTDDLGASGYASWELMGTLARRGHRVRGLFPEEASPAQRASGMVEEVPIPLSSVGRSGGFSDDREFVRAASGHLNSAAELLIRWPSGMGAVTVGGSQRTAGPVIGSVVESLALASFDSQKASTPAKGVRARVASWLDRRTTKRRETEALDQAALLLIDGEPKRELLQRYYSDAAARVSLLPSGVPDPLDVGDRAEARKRLKLPLDDPVVAFATPRGHPDDDGGPIAVEAFRRIRVFFPGARMVVVGAPGTRSESGVLRLGGGDARELATVLTAADVFLFPSREGGFALAPLYAMRFGRATIVSDRVALPGAAPRKDVRVVVGDDPGDYASELAELLADPAAQRTLGAAGRKYADSLGSDRIGARFEELFAPLLGR